MKKGLFLFVTIICAYLTGAQAAAAEPAVVYVNGARIDVSIVTVNGSILVPVRGVFETAGAIVDWDESNKSVTISLDDKTVTMQSGSSIISVVEGRQKIEYDYGIPVQIIDGSTRIPLRAAAECLGGQAVWNIYERAAYITFEENQPENPEPPENPANPITENTNAITIETGKAAIQLYDSRQSVYDQLGDPDRIDKMNQDFEWCIYNEDYNFFTMVGIQNNVAVAFYSNSANFSMDGISSGATEAQARSLRDSYSPGMITVYLDSLQGNQLNALLVQGDLNKSLNYLDSSVAQAIETQIIDICNAQRQKEGLSPLKMDAIMTASARAHSLDMANNNYFSHNSLDGRSAFVRMQEAGLRSYSLAAENIASGHANAADVCSGWFNSAGHRQNILNPYLTHIGVGVAANANNVPYYTQNFYATF